MKKSELLIYADLAKFILEKDTSYLRDKNVITGFFQKRVENYKESIFSRLSVIDYYYSTQMNKRYFKNPLLIKTQSILTRALMMTIIQIFLILLNQKLIPQFKRRWLSTMNPIINLALLLE